MKTLYHGSYTEVSAPLAKAVNHQLCILNQTVIDKYLHFVECITLQSEEDIL